ncbi:MAG: 30S ribosomal protein S19e [Euryarchaeota archaeon]|nr:30S ribosomal protein S19e [Euryarchaeota archaeon]
MTTAFDVPAEPLLRALSDHLRASDKLHVPEWAQFAKTGAHRERAPRDPNWWHTRCASILRRIYLDGPVGVSRLTTYYGGKERRGSAAARHARGSGSLIRDALQQMEKAGLVKKAKTGRIISPAGRKLLDSLARQIAPPAEKKAPHTESCLLYTTP